MTSPTPHPANYGSVYCDICHRTLSLPAKNCGNPICSWGTTLVAPDALFYREQALLSARAEGRIAGLKEAAEIARAAENQHRQNMTELDEAFAAGLIAQAIESRMTAPPEGK